MYNTNENSHQFLPSTGSNFSTKFHPVETLKFEQLIFILKLNVVINSEFLKCPIEKEQSKNSRTFCVSQPIVVIAIVAIL